MLGLFNTFFSKSFSVLCYSIFYINNWTVSKNLINIQIIFGIYLSVLPSLTSNSIIAWIFENIFFLSTILKWNGHGIVEPFVHIKFTKLTCALIYLVIFPEIQTMFPMMPGHWVQTDITLRYRTIRYKN